MANPAAMSTADPWLAMPLPPLVQQWQEQLGSGAPSLPTILVFAGLVLLLLPRLRRLVFDVVETVIASVLLVILVLVVLGLPFAAVYITFKGVVFLLRSLSGSFPIIRGLISLAAGHAAALSQGA